MIRERLAATRDWLETFPDPAQMPKHYTYGEPNEQGLITVASELHDPDFDIDWTRNGTTSGEDRVMAVHTADKEYVYVEGRYVFVQKYDSSKGVLACDSIVLEELDDLQAAPKDGPWQITPDLLVGQVSSISVKQGEFRQVQLDAAQPPLRHRENNNFDTLRQNAIKFNQMRLEQQQPAEVLNEVLNMEPAAEATPPPVSYIEEPKTEAEPTGPSIHTSSKWSSLLDKALNGTVQLVGLAKSELKKYYSNEKSGQSRRLASLAVAAVALVALNNPRSQN